MCSNMHSTPFAQFPGQLQAESTPASTLNGAQRSTLEAIEAPPSTYETQTKTESCRNSSQFSQVSRPVSTATTLPVHHDFTSVDDLEKGCHVEITEAPHELPQQHQDLPEKRHDRWLRNLRWTFLNVYERLSMLAILPNIAVMIHLLSQSKSFDTPTTLLTPVAVNIMVSVLIRQEPVINILFYVFGKTPKRLPLRIRRVAAKLYHLGGIHSGCGVAALLWFFLFNVAVAKMMDSSYFREIRLGIFLITIALDLLLASIIILSLPIFRERYHNTWEQSHRFAGWLVVTLFWSQFFLFAVVQARSGVRTTVFQVLVRSPNFYFLTVTTICLILPWLRLRRVAVHAEPLSDHAVRLHFKHTNLAICTTPRFSDHPMKEWHAFAAIPADDGSGYSVMVSKAGDWTTKIIQNPPKQLWTKGTPARGALYMAQIFKRVVVVATGSGIAPVLSLLHAPDLDCRILWSTPNPEKVFAPYILDYIKRVDRNAVIIDTRKLGRPNLIQEAYDLYIASQAEAVFVISNAAVTRKVIYGLESRGVPAFAPIFDS